MYTYTHTHEAGGIVIQTETPLASMCGIKSQFYNFIYLLCIVGVIIIYTLRFVVRIEWFTTCKACGTVSNI